MRRLVPLQSPAASASRPTGHCPSFHRQPATTGWSQPETHEQFQKVPAGLLQSTDLGTLNNNSPGRRLRESVLLDIFLKLHNVGCELPSASEPGRETATSLASSRTVFSKILGGRGGQPGRPPAPSLQPCIPAGTCHLGGAARWSSFMDNRVANDLTRFPEYWIIRNAG